MAVGTSLRDAAVDTSPARPRAASACPVGALERLPKWVNLIPMVAQWLWLSVRYGSPTLPSAANPTITCGGLAGEGKLEYFDIMGQMARAATAPYTFIHNEGALSLNAAVIAMQVAGLDYPVIAKPNIGWCGFGVRLVRNRAELLTYLSSYPIGECIILQHFVTFEGEAGVYYMRHPDEAKGRIVGILLRSFPRVTGDGVRTIEQLINADIRLRRLARDERSEPCCDVRVIPAVGECVRVTTIGSTRVGGLYRDASAMITEELTNSIDAIARDMADFHVGRFDIRYESLGALRAGNSFKIIEVNGAGSEAVHAWDPAHSLRKAYGIIFKKQRDIFEIGDAMRRKGHRPVAPFALARQYLRQQQLIRLYPRSN